MSWASKGGALAMLALSTVAAWASWQLDVWSFIGPGPGLFPMLISGLCMVLATIVLLTPSPPAAEGDASDEGPLEPPERTTFAMYLVALVALAAGTAWLGLFLTCMLVCLIIVRFGERRSLGAALFAGACMGLIGVVLFGWILKVEIPTSYPEALIYQMLR